MSEMRPAPVRRTCLNCGADRYNRRKEWCDPCYDRWRYAGRPESGPPEPRDRRSPQCLEIARRNIQLAWAARRRKSADRVEDYSDLVYEFGESRENAAARVGVGIRTMWRYEKRIKEAAGAGS